LTIVWTSFEFQLVVFKLCSKQEKSNGKVTKGNNTIITLDRVIVLVVDHCMKLFEFQPVVFKLYSGQGKVTKGNNSEISENGVMVLMHCISS
jgi:amino acid permease